MKLIFLEYCSPLLAALFLEGFAQKGKVDTTQLVADVGLAGHVSLAASLLYVTAIYAFQVLYSNLLLRDPATGPMEKLWRRLTYGKTAKPGIQLDRHQTINDQ